MRLTDIDIKPRIKLKESKVLIRETRTPQQILLELNVINIPAIDEYLKDIASRLPQKLQKWFISRTKKYIINSNEDNVQVTRFSGKAEPWMKQRQEEGVALYRFHPTNGLTTNLNSTVDWLTATYNIAIGETDTDQATKQRANKTIKGINSTTISQAIEKSNAWHEALQQQQNATDSKGRNTGDISVKDEEKEGLEFVISADENHAWFLLPTQKCLDREGGRMGHCVASYGHSVKEGYTKIYSLRDKNNRPSATLEVKHNEVTQIKGKGNQPPVGKYIKPTLALLNHLKLPASGMGETDLHSMGILYNADNGSYATLANTGELVYKASDKSMLKQMSMRSRYSGTENYIAHVFDNQIIGKFEITDKDDRALWRASDDTDLNIDEKTKSIIIQYVNGLPKSKRPIIKSNRYGSSGQLTQNHKTFQVGRTVLDISEPLAKYGHVQIHQFLNPNYPKQTKYAVILNNKVNSGDFLFTISQTKNDSDTLHAHISRKTIIKDYKKDIVKALNKLKIGQHIDPSYGDVNQFENNEIFYNVATKEFSTDYTIAGHHFEHDDKLRAIKTANKIRLFINDNQIVEFDIIIQQGNYRHSKPQIAVDKMKIHDRLQFLNHLPGIANTLNNYNILRQPNLTTRDDEKNVNKNMGAAGFKYKDNTWSSLKTKPKAIIKGKTDGHVFEIYAYRKEFMVLDVDSGKTILKASGDDKNDIDKINSSPGSITYAVPMIIDALQALNEKGVTIRNSALQIHTKTALNNRGYMIGDDHKLVEIEDVHPTEVVLKTDYGRWVRQAYTPYEGNYNKKSHADHKNRYSRPSLLQMSNDQISWYSFVNRKTVKLRVQTAINYNTNNEEIREIYIIDYDNNTMLKPKHRELSEYSDAIGKLMKATNIRIGKLVKEGFYYNSGKLLSINDNPKLKGFLDGIIAYEDGHIWKRGNNDYNKHEWTLQIKKDNGYYASLLHINIDDNGIKEIKFKDERIRKNTRLYRPYLNDMLDINDDIHGGED